MGFWELNIFWGVTDAGDDAEAEVADNRNFTTILKVLEIVHFFISIRNNLNVSC